jgi:hypothetical protein
LKTINILLNKIFHGFLVTAKLSIKWVKEPHCHIDRNMFVIQATDVSKMAPLLLHLREELMESQLMPKKLVPTLKYLILLSTAVRQNKLERLSLARTLGLFLKKT